MPPRNLAAALAGLHPSDSASQDIARSLRARLGRGCENGEAFRPIAKLAHRDIDLQRIDRAFDQGLEWPQRTPAVEAEQVRMSWAPRRFAACSPARTAAVAPAPEPWAARIAATVASRSLTGLT